jgi:hypothetical protein
MASWLGSGNLTTNVFHHSSPRLGGPSSQIRIECYDCTVTADEYEKPPPEEKEQDANSRMEMSSTPAQDVYEIRPRNDRDGFDLISDRLRRGPIWYAGPDAVRNAVSFAKYTSRSRSRWAIIRVYDEAGNVTEAHEQ